MTVQNNKPVCITELVIQNGSIKSQTGKINAINVLLNKDIFLIPKVH